MNASAVKTSADFVHFIKDLVDREIFIGSLEEYLRALWTILSAKRDIEPSWSFFANCLHEAFFVPASDFDEAWMDYEKPPALNNDTAKNNFACVEKMLLYQIADFQRIKNAKLIENAGQFAFLGISSPTKNTWYNFSVESFLEGATAGFNIKENGCSWLALAVFLRLGQIYE
jgi:hypothetical protein